MSGGLFLSSSDEALPNVNLNLTDHQNTTSVPTNELTNWFENMLVANLINNWYKSNNVYIVLIPYGQVLGLNAANSLESFTADICNNTWISGGELWGQVWNDTVLASCEESGMAVLMNGGTEKSPSFYEVANMTYNGETYSPRQMVTSSVSAFVQYGFK